MEVGQNEGQVSALRQTRGTVSPTGVQIVHQAPHPVKLLLRPFHGVMALNQDTGRGLFWVVQMKCDEFSCLWPFTPILVEPTENLDKSLSNHNVSTVSAGTQCY